MEFPEVIRVVLVIVVLPMFFMLSKRLRPASGARTLSAAFLVICVSFVAALIEGIPAVAGVADAVQHAGYAVAGVLAAMGSFQVRRSILAERRPA